MLVASRLMRAFGKNKPIVPTKKQVLIIDDDAMSTMILLKCLNETYNVVSKNDGDEAMNYLDHNINPDLIILDIEMPNMNGRVFLRQLKSCPGVNKIPVIVVSSVENKTMRNSIVKTGIASYFTKPIHKEELLNGVRKVLAN
jgi:CheY-like chemotaxis protein